MKKISKKHKIVAFVAAIALLASGFKYSPSDESIKSRVVMLIAEGRGGCSGEQIEAPSGATYILSAGHCAHIADSQGNITVITEDGKVMKRRIIQEDSNSDLLLIEGVPNLSGLKIAKNLNIPEDVRTFTHGRLLPTHKTVGETVGKKKVLIPIDKIESLDQESKCNSQSKNKVLDTMFGKLCVLFKEVMVTTARVTPGSSGGPVVNSSGELIGVASATDGDFGYLVTLEDIQAFVANY